jgi:hypothetical protein
MRGTVASSYPRSHPIVRLRHQTPERPEESPKSLQHGITFSLERNAERGSCETRGAHIYSSAKSPGHPGARITAIGLDSADASVSVVAPGGIESQIQLRRVTGAWKIANF